MLTFGVIQMMRSRPSAIEQLTPNLTILKSTITNILLRILWQAHTHYWQDFYIGFRLNLQFEMLYGTIIAMIAMIAMTRMVNMRLISYCLFVLFVCGWDIRMIAISFALTIVQIPWWTNAMTINIFINPQTLILFILLLFVCLCCFFVCLFDTFIVHFIYTLCCVLFVIVVLFVIIVVFVCLMYIRSLRVILLNN